MWEDRSNGETNLVPIHAVRVHCTRLPNVKSSMVVDMMVRNGNQKTADGKGVLNIGTNGEVWLLDKNGKVSKGDYELKRTCTLEAMLMERRFVASSLRMAEMCVDVKMTMAKLQQGSD